MPLIVRYVNKDREIQESFLGFIECEQETSGEQLATLLESTFQSLGLDVHMCRGQGYDGASNMSGAAKGACTVVESFQSSLRLCISIVPLISLTYVLPIHAS